MFNHALTSGILFGVPLGVHGKMCHLQYANDLLVVTAGGQEDLRIIKLILVLFEGISGLKVNYHKTCLFSSEKNKLPEEHLARTFNCVRGTLPVSYLGIPISGCRPSRQVWEELISKIRSKLQTWKAKLLSFGGRLTLVNSVLSATPNYWMSIFKLPCWVIKAIDRIRRDFLWSGPDIDHPKMRLVKWHRICRPREQGGWRILNLAVFNNALLAKWWWKLTSGASLCGDKIVMFNYSNFAQGWNLHSKPHNRRSFIWNGLLHNLPAFQAGVSSVVVNGEKTLFWLDRWVDNCAPKNLWPDLFIASNRQFGTVKELIHLTQESWFKSDHVELAERVANLGLVVRGAVDTKKWALTSNGIFSVKSLYSFLIHGGVTCGITNSIWNSPCPKKIILFNWLVWDNSILTLSNLAARGCNKLPTATCVLCNADIETVDHLFLLCPFVVRLWAFLAARFHFPPPPRSVEELWGSWRALIPKPIKDAVDLVIRSLLWHVWLERNARIFNNAYSVHQSVLLKVIYMFLSWINAVPDAKKAKLEGSVSTAKRSLQFLGGQTGIDMFPTE